MLSPSFRVPRTVVQEIGAGPPNDPTVQWLAAPSIASHFVDTPPPPPFLAQWDLGAGETSVLSLALADVGSPVVLDDLAARKFAQTFQIPMLGTLGLLVRAKHEGHIPQVAPLIQKLEAASANLAPSVVKRALELARENP